MASRKSMDRNRRARRAARAVLGAVKPGRVITPKPLRKTKYKRAPGDEES